MKKILSGFCCLLLFLLAGCAANTNMESFARQGVDISYIERVAVMPVQNNSKDTFVAERVRDMVITQILANGMFDVVDKGLVDSALRDEAVNLAKAPMDNAVMKRLGQRLNVQAFLLGTIDNAEQVQRGAVSFPDLAITLRLVDASTGSIFWQASGHRSGDSLGKRLFGLGSDDSFKVSMKLLRHLLDTIPTGKNTVAEQPAESGSDGGAVLPVESAKGDNSGVFPADEQADQTAPDEIIIDGNGGSGDQQAESKNGDSSSDDEIIFDSDNGGDNDLSAPDSSASDSDTKASSGDGSADEEVILPDFSSGDDGSADSIIDDSSSDANSDGADLNDDNVEPDMIPPE